MQNRRNAVYIIVSLSLAAGLFTGRAFFFNLAYTFAGLMVVSFIWSWFSVRWISIGRRTRARRAQVGRNLEEVFTVRNRSFLPKLWLEIRDHSNLPDHRASNVVPAMAARSVYRWNVKTPCLSRGEFRLGPITLISGDPFGLFVAPRRLAATSRVIVYPATVPLRDFRLPIGLLSGGEAQRRRTHFITTNAAGVRDYVTGDSFNRIHWPTTARKDRLVVKEFEIDPLADIWLFVDFSAKSVVEDPSVERIDGNGPVIPRGPGIPPSTEEYIAVVAASLAEYFLETDRAVGFAAYIPYRSILQPDRGSRQLTNILQNLALARSQSPYTLGEMLILETPYFTRGTTLIIITASLDAAWVHEAQVLKRRGIRPMSILVDPHSFGGTTPSDEIETMVHLANVPSMTIHKGDDLSVALTQRPM